MTGIAGGTTTINYILATGCAASVIVTVHAAPPAITGAMSMCVGANSTLGDAAGGGIWSSGGTGVATVSTGGLVTGLTLGTETISYEVAGCPAMTTVTVNALPAAISGPGNVCAGSVILLTDASPGGTWSSPAGAGVVSVTTGSGVVLGESEGLATITYSIGVGCSVSTVVTVNPLPPAITGATTICVGASVALSDSITGGTWSIGLGSAAFVSATGVATGVTGGIGLISYTISTGCTTSTEIPVNSVPPIIGSDHVCGFSDTTHMSDSASGGAWTSTLVTISSSGLVTGFATGVGSVTYTMSSGCYATKLITVNPVPDAITGTTHFCIGATETFGDATAGGVWSPAVATVATVGPTGIVTAVSDGIESISYTLPATGCKRTVTVTVDPLPNAGTIVGSDNVCEAGATIVLTDAAAGGVWTSSSVTATITTGTVTGLTAGIDTIKYSFTNICGTAVATKVITINPLPDAGSISAVAGVANLCTGTTISLSDGMPGGAWSESGGGYVSVSAAGTVNGLSQGIDTIVYSVTNICGVATAKFVVTVNSIPAAGLITGSITKICAGSLDTLAGIPQGGTWSAANGDATVSAGVVTGIAAGMDTIYYSIANECGPAVAAFPITILDRSSCDTSSGIKISGAGMNGIKVYPNPNEGSFTVVVNSSVGELMQISITNVTGEVVKEYTATTNAISVVKLDQPAGVYFLSASTAHERYVVKVVIAQ